MIILSSFTYTPKGLCLDHENFKDVFKSGYCSTELSAQLPSTCSGLHVITEDYRGGYQILRG